MDPRPAPHLLSFHLRDNGSHAKRTTHYPALQPPPAPAPESEPQYRECLKNHAAALGGHATDGCGEFMPSPSSNPSDPTSLRCAACGCDRNFHHRLLLDPHHHPATTAGLASSSMPAIKAGLGIEGDAFLAEAFFLDRSMRHVCL